MATTETIRRDAFRWGDGYLITAVDLSTIDPGQTIDCEHGGPSGVEPERVTYNVRTRGTRGGRVMDVTYEADGNSTSNDTARIRVEAPTGDDLTGCVVRVFFHFAAQASGGIS